MKILYHGKWSVYKPASRNPNAPPNTVYARRESDGMDWYNFIHDNHPFKKGSVIVTLVNTDMGLVIGAAVYEADRLFPDYGHIIEIEGYTGKNPQKDFGNKFFDLEELTVSSDTVNERIIRLYKETDKAC